MSWSLDTGREYKSRLYLNLPQNSYTILHKTRQKVHNNIGISFTAHFEFLTLIKSSKFLNERRDFDNRQVVYARLRKLISHTCNIYFPFYLYLHVLYSFESINIDM